MVVVSCHVVSEGLQPILQFPNLYRIPEDISLWHADTDRGTFFTMFISCEMYTRRNYKRILSMRSAAGGSMAICIHEINRELCSLCKSPPKGIKSTVYFTAGGQVFHNDRDCPLLRLGQSSAATQGLKNHDIKSATFGRIEERGACDWCCALFNAIQQNSMRQCWIRNGTKWQEAYLLTSRLLTTKDNYKIFEYKVTTDKKIEFVVSNNNLKMFNPLTLPK